MLRFASKLNLDRKRHGHSMLPNFLRGHFNERRACLCKTISGRRARCARNHPRPGCCSWIFFWQIDHASVRWPIKDACADSRSLTHLAAAFVLLQYRDQSDGFLRILAEAIGRLAALDEPDSSVPRLTEHRKGSAGRDAIRYVGMPRRQSWARQRTTSKSAATNWQALGKAAIVRRTWAV
jgi:hypothetical protein